MLIHKDDFKACLPVAMSKAAKGEYFFQAILVDPEKKKLFVSNGHSLYFLEADTLNPEDFPVGPDKKDVPELAGKVLIPAEALDTVVKGVKKVSLRMFEYVHVGVSDSVVTLSTVETDAWNTKSVKHRGDPHTDYPDAENIIRSMEGTIAEGSKSTSLSVSELELLIKVAKARGAGYVNMTVKSKTTPVKVKLKNSSETLMTGYIMPCKD